MMANAFDEFDNAPTTPAAPAPAAGGSNAFDQFDPSAAAVNPASKGILANIASGANTQVANLVGLPKELIKIPFQLAGGALDWAGGNTIGGLHTAANVVRSAPDYIPLADIQQTKEALTGVGGFPTDVTVPVRKDVWVKDPTTGRPVRQSQLVQQPLPATVRPQDVPERLAYGAGQGLGAAATFPLEIGAATQLAPEVAASPLYTSSIPTAQEVGRMVTPAADTALGTLRATANQAGLGVVSGLGGAAGAELAPEKYKPYAEMAGQILGGGGYAGTQALGSWGLQQLGKIASPYFNPELAAGQRLAGAATNAPVALENLRSASYEPELVPGSRPTTAEATGDIGLAGLQRQVETGAREDFALRRGEQAAARTGAVQQLAPETADPEAVGNLFKTQLKDLTDQHDQALAQAKAATDAKLGTLGGQAEEGGVYGRAMRQELQKAYDAVDAREGRIWNSLEPFYNTPVDVTPLKTAANEITSKISSRGTPLQGEEANIFGRLQDDAPWTFGDLKQFRQSVTDALRERDLSPTQAMRLRSLVSGVDDSLGQSVAKIQQANPQEDLLARISAAAKEVPSGQAVQTGTGPSAGAGTLAVPETSAPAVGATHAQEVPPSGRPGGAAGDQGVSGEELGPIYQQARAATAEKYGKFGEEPIAGALEKKGGKYVLTDEQAANDIIRSGPSGGAAVEKFLNAIPDKDVATQRLSDMYAWKMRNTPGMMNPDGTVNATRLDTWMKQNAPAMDRLPDVKAKFADVASAQKALDDVTAARSQAIDEFQNSAARRFLGENVNVQQQVGKTIGNSEEFGNLVDAVKDDPAAMAGLKKATIDHMMAKTQSNTLAPGQEVGALKADTYQNFIKNNRASLAKLFTPEELKTMENVAADLQRSATAREAANIPGRSNTTADIMAQAKGQNTLLGQLAREGAGAAAGAMTAGPAGAAAGSVVGRLWNSMRNIGITRVDELVKQAMLHPDLARVLLTKGTATPTPYIQNRLLQQLTTTLGASNANSSKSQ